MPKHRNQTQNCSFCGKHKNEVPLMVTSHLSPESACCSTCALTIVHQTQSWAYGIFHKVMQEEMRQRDADRKIMLGDGVDTAIRKANSGA